MNETIEKNGNQPQDLAVKQEIDRVEEAFIELGIYFDLEANHKIIERLAETGEHFEDAVEMTKIIDLLWEKFGITSVTKEELKLCALLHDVGKSGPAEASSELRACIKDIFTYSTGSDIKIKPETTIAQYLELEGLDCVAYSELLKTDLDIDTENETILHFWRRHADWTEEILEQHIDGIGEKILAIASSHHILDGKIPKVIKKIENIPEDASVIKVLDKYNITSSVDVVTLVDKYQAAHERGAKTHEEVIKILRGMIDNSPSLEEQIKKRYHHFVDILEQSQTELESIVGSPGKDA